MDGQRVTTAVAYGARADEAFAEIQRADTKATALCGVAGGLLTLSVTVLVQAEGASGFLVYGLAAVCVLLASAIIAALGALRPALPRAGLPAALAEEAGCPQVEGGALTLARSTSDARRLRVLAALAGRKFRAVRLAVDLVRIALVMAGFALLMDYLTS